ncbi:MAG: hypothetical protein ACRD6B_00260 [Bryobacteraceae bacterium]
MAFCSNCGAQVAGGFCQNCGTQMAGAAGGAAEATASPAGAQAAGLSTNAASALCYLFGFITGIIFLVLGPYNQNKTVRFHAFQSIFLNVAGIVFFIIWGIITTLTSGFAALLYPLWALAWFALWLYLLFTAYNGKTVTLPVIGEFARKQA